MQLMDFISCSYNLEQERDKFIPYCLTHTGQISKHFINNSV